MVYAAEREKGKNVSCGCRQQENTHVNQCTGEDLGHLLHYMSVVAPKTHAQQNERSEPTKCRTPANVQDPAQREK